MAWVGPRPETEEYVLRWKHVLPGYERRFGVLPGMTGLAQVSGYSDTDPRGIARRAQYDLYYVDHCSLLLDVRTMARALLLAVRGQSPTPAPPNFESRSGTPSRLTDPAHVDGVTTTYGVSQATHVKGVTR